VNFGMNQKWAKIAAGLIHDLHRTRFPLTRRTVLPPNVRAMEANLLHIHEVFGRHGVTFWLRDGTALGVYRDGAILRWDDDTDLGVWLEDLPKIDAALAELKKLGFTVYLRTPHVIGLLRRWETAEIVVSGVATADDEYTGVLETFFRKLTTVSFLGRDFHIPMDINGYFEFSYGPDWRTPKPCAWWASSWWLPQAARTVHVRKFVSQRPRGLLS
jgi:hypothetical protein